MVANQSSPSSSVQFAEIRSLKRVQQTHESVGTENQILETFGIIDPITGRTMTVANAIQMRVLDVRTGEIVINERGDRVTLDEAVRRRLIDANLAGQLLQPGTTTDHTGRPLSLLEVIQREILEAENGYDSTEKRIKVTSTSSTTTTTKSTAVADNNAHAITIADAIRTGLVDQKTGYYCDPKMGIQMSISDAYDCGYLTRNETVTIKPNAICLSDAIVHDLVDPSGWVVDRNSGDKFRLDSAISMGLIDPRVREIVDAKNDTKVTLQHAIDTGTINSKTGRYMQNVTKEKLTFSDAKQRQLISKPLTLKDVCDLNLMDSAGKIYSPARRCKLSIGEAIDAGVLDGNTIKSITVRKGELVTLSEAMDMDVIQADRCRYKDIVTGEIITIPDAVERGLISSVSQRSIFNIDVFRDPYSGDFISFNQALSKNILRRRSGEFLLDSGKGNLVDLSQGISMELVRPEVYEMLMKKIGVSHPVNGNELTVLDLVCLDLIDPKSGYLLDPETKVIVPLDRAIERKLITPEGALLLSSLLNITLTTETVTKTIKRYVTITESTERAEEQTEVLSFTDAVRHGLIDESRQMFKDPKTQQIYSVQQALNHGLIVADDVQSLNNLNETIISPQSPAAPKMKTITIVRKSIQPDIQTSPIHTAKSTTVLPSRTIPETSELKTQTIDFMTNERAAAVMTAERQILELPPEGWFLSEAIAEKLFDTNTGLFTVPGTDRLVSFEECIKLQIINPHSATVLDPYNDRKLAVLRSFEKRILDATGNYKSKGRVMGMREAIDCGRIVLERPEKIDATNQRLIQITKVPGRPDVVEVSSSDSSPLSFKPVKVSSQDSGSPEPVQLAPGVIYDPSTALVIFTDSGRSESILTAVQAGRIDENLVQFIDPSTNQTISLTEAIKKSIINPKTGEIFDKSNGGQPMSLIDAVKFGVLAVAGAPLVAVAGAINTLKLISDPKTGEQIPIELAYERGIVSRGEAFPPETILFKDPKSGAEMSLTEALTKGLISPSEAKKCLGSNDDLTRKSTPELPAKELIGRRDQTSPLKSVVDKSSRSGSSSPVVKPISDELISAKQNLKSIKRDSPLTVDNQSSIRTMTLESISLTDETLPSHGELTRARVTTEPKYQVSIGRARFSQSPEKEARPVVLQKMRKKIIRPKDAVQKGIIDEETAAMLDKRELFLAEDGEKLTLFEVVSQNRIDGNRGKIVDPQRGDVVNIYEAMNRGILNRDGTNQVLIPLNKSLSLIQLESQGLLDVPSSKIVHPETGVPLTLKEAIVCEIVDPLSIMIEPTGQKVTLQSAIDQGCIDAAKLLIVTPTGSVDVLTAIKQDVFEIGPMKNNDEMPLLGMTFPVAVKRGLIDPNTQEIIHPITKKRQSISDAIRTNFIMALPFAPNVDGITIEEALQSGLIDATGGTFRNPKTNEQIPITEAVETGLLVIKDLPELMALHTSGTVTSTTETVTSYHTITTKTVEITSGFALVSANKVQNIQTGEIISLDEAKRLGIVKDECQTQEQFATREIKVNFSDAIRRGLVDIRAGTYTDPTSGTIMPIQQAVDDGILETTESSLDESDDSDQKMEMLSLSEAIDSIYDDDAQKIRDPKNPERLVTFAQAIEERIVDSKTVVYDIQTGQMHTLEDGIREGLIDKQTGGMKQTDGSTISLKNAAKMGLLAVVGAPVLAGMAVASAVKKATDGILKKSDKDRPIGQNLSSNNSDVIQSVPKFQQTEKSEIFIPKPTINNDSNKIDADFDVSKILPIIKSDSQVKDPPIVISSDNLVPLTSGSLETQKPMNGEDMLKDHTIDVNELSAEIVEPLVKSIDSQPEKEDVGQEKICEEHLTSSSTSSTATYEIISKHMQLSTLAEMSESIDSQSAFQLETEPEHSGKSPDKHVTFEIPQLLIDELPTSASPSVDDQTNSQQMPIGDAISLSKIIPNSCRILHKGDELELNVQQAIDAKDIDPSDMVEVITSTLVILLDKPPPEYELEITQSLSPVHVAKLGAYDIESDCFTDPQTGDRISFLNFLYDLGLFDPHSIYVKDTSANIFEPLEVALEKPLIDKNTGHMVDRKTGKRVPFFECIERGWIVQRHEKEMEPVALHTVNVDPQTGEICLDNGSKLSLAEAIHAGVIDVDGMSIRDPATLEVIPLLLAIERGVVDLKRGTIINTKTGSEITLSSAYGQGSIIAGLRRPISLKAVVHKGLYDSASGQVFDPIEQRRITVQDAIDRGIVEPSITCVRDTKADQVFDLPTAIAKNIIDPVQGTILDTKNQVIITFETAVIEEILTTKTVSWDLFDVLTKQYYMPSSGKILNPMTGNLQTLKETIDCGFVNMNSTLVKDEVAEKIIPSTEAIAKGLIDANRGVLTQPEMPLSTALQKGFLLSTKKPLSLTDALIRNLYDPITGLLTIDGETMTLDEALSRGLIQQSDLIVRDPKTGNICSLAEAIKLGIIQPKTGLFIDPNTGQKLTLLDALEGGLLHQSKRKCSLPDAVFKGLYDPKSGTFSSTVTAEKLSTERAIKRGIIDPQSTIVNVAGKVLPFELAVENGIVNARRGTVVDDYGNKIDFREAFDRGILIEVKKPISLCEALLKGLYDEETGLFMDPQSGKRLTIAQSLARKLIDPNSVQMKDTVSGLYKNISLLDATESGLINGQNAQVLFGDERISLQKAFDNGFLSDSKAPISIQRAIHQGLYDDKTGKIHDISTDRKITLFEAIRKYIINPHLPCYFNDRDEQLMSLADTCRAKLIDRREGVFKEPGSNVFISLNEALALGFIVDIENAGFGLFEALAMGLYDPDTKEMIHPVNGRKMSLRQACAEDLVSKVSSLVKHSETGKYIDLDEAIRTGLIDDQDGVYMMPKYAIDLQEARKRGLIVTKQKLLSLEQAVRNQLFRPETGKFVDPSTCVYHDLQEAIDIGFIDPETTVFKNLQTGQQKPLHQAIAEGDIDVTKGRVLDPKSKRSYNFDVALSNGLLVTVDRPITGRTVARRDSLDLLGSPVTKIPREMTLDDAIRYEIINIETAVVKDPMTGKFQSLSGLITAGNVDTEQRAVVDPKSLFFTFSPTFVVYNREPLSFDGAVESKQLDLSTGKFTTNSDDQNQTYALKEAVVLGHIDPESALIKDGVKKKLVRLPEAYRKGLIDADKANCLDTTTSKLSTLEVAVDSGLLVTPKRPFGLLEALGYNLYNPTTGGFTDPFVTTSVIDRKRLTLADAIASGLIDPTTTMVRDLTNQTIVPLVAALGSGLIDPISGRYIDATDTKEIDFIKAYDRGLLLPAEARVSNHQRKFHHLIPYNIKTSHIITVFFLFVCVCMENYKDSRAKHYKKKKC